MNRLRQTGKLLYKCSPLGTPWGTTRVVSLSLSLFLTCTMGTITNNTWVHTTNKTAQVAGEGWGCSRPSSCVLQNTTQFKISLASALSLSLSLSLSLTTQPSGSGSCVWRRPVSLLCEYVLNTLQRNSTCQTLALLIAPWNHPPTHTSYNASHTLTLPQALLLPYKDARVSCCLLSQSLV